jgi:hypothetical protein
MISPRICAQRILHGLEYTANPALPHNWNLPQDLIREEENAGLPTKNLLGWAGHVVLPVDAEILAVGGEQEEEDNQVRDLNKRKIFPS